MSTRKLASHRRTAGRAGPLRASILVIFSSRWARPLRGGTRVAPRSHARGHPSGWPRLMERGRSLRRVPRGRQPTLCVAGHTKPISTPVSGGGGNILSATGPDRKAHQGPSYRGPPRCGCAWSLSAAAVAPPWGASRGTCGRDGWAARGGRVAGGGTGGSGGRAFRVHQRVSFSWAMRTRGRGRGRGSRRMVMPGPAAPS